MLQALSVQSDVLGQKTYGQNIRYYFSQYEDIHLNSCWYREGRSLPVKVLNKLAHMPVPFLSGNRDYWRLRVEYAQAYTARRLVLRKYREAPFGMMHIHTQAQALASVGLMGRIPTVVTADMTAYQASRESTVKFPWTYEPNIRLERRVFHAARHVVTFCEWARRSMIEEHGVSPEKVTAILPGARLADLKPARFEPQPKPRILFMGRDFSRKGGPDLLAVFRERFADRAELHIATDHALPEVMPGVFLHKNIQAYTDAWHELFRQSDIFVLASYAEALPNVFQEAAGYGLALIGSDVGGIPEMVVDGENGFTIPPGDRGALTERLRVLLDDPALLGRMRRRSRALAEERFDAARNMRRLADLFLAVAAAG